MVAIVRAACGSVAAPPAAFLDRQQRLAPFCEGRCLFDDLVRKVLERKSARCVWSVKMMRPAGPDQEGWPSG